jgi:crotonobetainyl-CoA:carnitine CoA-transferase CaiB-like acyl-CoA transferase
MLQALRNRNGPRGIIPIDIPGIGVYECKDGHVYGYVGSPGGAPWIDLLAWMIEEGAAEDLTEEPYHEVCRSLSLRFLSGIATDPEVAKKLGSLPHVDEVLRRFIASKGRWEMYQEAQKRRLLFGIVSTPEDIANNPQLRHKKWLTAVEHPELNDTLQYPGTPYHLSETPWAIRRRPPLLGEHNDEVYGGELGLSQQQLNRLRAEGVV